MMVVKTALVWELVLMTDRRYNLFSKYEIPEMDPKRLQQITMIESIKPEKVQHRKTES
jgi:hypothetical protein